MSRMSPGSATAWDGIELRYPSPTRSYALIQDLSGKLAAVYFVFRSHA